MTTHDEKNPLAAAPAARARAPRRTRSFAAVAAALALWVSAEPALAACQPASYCQRGGACISLSQAGAQAKTAYGRDGYTVTRVRLRGHGPTATCLWYEIVLTHPNRAAKIVMWDVAGGEVR